MSILHSQTYSSSQAAIGHRIIIQTFMSLFGWLVHTLLVREEVLLAGLYERKIFFRLKDYDRLRQATAKRTSCMLIQIKQNLHNN